MKHPKRYLLTLAALGLGLGSGLAAHAETIAWTQWTGSSANGYNPGSATGTIALGSGVTVTYTGQLGGLENDTDWTPASSYVGGTVSNAPDSAPVVWMYGGQSYTETISFSQAVTDPTIALWSLGSSQTTAVFDFAAGETFSVEGCGPSNLAGGCITASGEEVSGGESAGTIQFAGTYDSLTFTTPVYEYWCDFTVGAAGLPTVTPPPAAATPEPSSLALLGTGLTAMTGLIRRRLQKA